jgi:molecular chaperone Hsp33
MTDDGGFRVMTAITTETVRGVLRAQKVKGDLARTFADLITGTILVRETMSPGYRVQGIVHGADRSGVLAADSHPDGGTRGIVQRAPRLGPGGALEMMRTLPHGGVAKGIVAMPDAIGVSSSLMAYLQESEQVVSVIAAGAVFDGDTLVAAGGYLVQLLPELSEAMLAIMTERLKDFPAIESILRDAAATPESLMQELLYGMPHTLLADSPLAYQCRCDAQRVLASLATLPRHEIKEMADAGKTLEINCDYCGTEYRIEPSQLRGLLAPS